MYVLHADNRLAGSVEAIGALKFNAIRRKIGINCRLLSLYIYTELCLISGPLEFNSKLRVNSSHGKPCDEPAVHRTACHGTWESGEQFARKQVSAL